MKTRLMLALPRVLVAAVVAFWGGSFDRVQGIEPPFDEADRLPSGPQPMPMLLAARSADAGEDSLAVSNPKGGGAPAAVVPINLVPLGDALDLPASVWTTGGAAGWLGQTDVSSDGTDAAQSGAVGANQESWLEARFPGPGVLTFWWKISSEAGFDFLEVGLDGSNVLDRISGEADWRARAITLLSGHTVRWRYVKDGSVSDGLDAAWLDQVGFTLLAVPPQMVTSPADQQTVEGGAAEFTVQVQGSSPFYYQWHFNGLAIPGARQSRLQLANATFNHAGAYTVAVSNAFGTAISAPAWLTVVPAGVGLAVFNDARYVDVQTNYAGEAGNVMASLTNLGYVVLGLTNLEAAAGYRRLVIPELERADLAPDLAPATLVSLSNWVYRGGRVIVHGEGHGRAAALLNRLLGLNLEEQFCGGILSRTPAAEGTAFAAAPPGLSPLSSTMGLVSNTLPADATSLYAWTNLSGVALWPVGDGTVIYLGWDWYDAVPRGAQDGGWLEVLNLAVEPGPAPEGTPPWILVPPANLVVSAGNVAQFAVRVYGSEPLAYVWQHNGVLLASETNAVLTLPEANTNLAGIYTVTVTNLYGAITGPPARLTVTIPLPVALDATNLAWRTGGHASWFGQAEVTRDGEDAAQSGSLAADQQSFLETIVTGPAILTFWWKVSSEAGYDWLEFSINGELQPGRISGEVDWTYMSFGLPGGTHVLRWQYAKDVTLDGGLDRGWVDQVSFRPSAVPPQITQQPFSQTNVVGGDAMFSVRVEASPPLRYQWQLNGAEIPGATNADLLLANLTLDHAGQYSVRIGNPYGAVTSRVATLTVFAIGPDLVDDFDPDLDRWQWLSFSGVVEANGHGGSVSPPNALWFGGSGDRWAMTRSLDTTRGGLVRFALRFADGNDFPWEHLDLPTERVVLEAFPEGGASLVLAEFSEDRFYDWTPVTLMIPPAAQSPQTRFRWRQNANSGRCCDHWALDNVQIIVTDPGPIIVASPESQTKPLGTAAEFSVETFGQPPLTYQWLHDGALLTGETHPVLILTNLQPASAGGYAVAVANAHGAVTSRVAQLVVLLNLPGGVDVVTFDPGTGPDDVVTTLALQPDGRILMGGNFTTVDGTRCVRIARLHPDGHLDLTFNPGLGPDDWVRTIALQQDGKILVGGDFMTVNGTPRSRIARLNDDGSVDNFFQPGAGADQTIWVISLQADGRILAGGDFTQFNGLPTLRIIRLLADGTLDDSFNSDIGFTNTVLVLEEWNDHLYAGGRFAYYNGNAARYLARLLRNGQLDSSFDPGMRINGLVDALVIQPDDKLLLGGGFGVLHGTSSANVARFNPDGTLDASFDPGTGGQSAVTSLALQSDGKVIVAGGFTRFDGQPRNRYARLHADGRLDPLFTANPGANDWVESVVLESSGSILIGGNFTQVDGVPRPRIARLYGNEPTQFAPVITRQPASLTVVEGADVELLVEAIGVPAVSVQWQVNGSPIAGATSPTLRLFNVRSADAGSYTAIVSNSLGTVVSEAAGLTVPSAPARPGAPHIDFYAGSGTDGAVNTLAVQADGRILIGGSFSDVNGTLRSRIARLEAAGALDPTFDPGLGANRSVLDVVALSDGTIYLGGEFTTLNGMARPGLARLLANGSVDLSFVPALSGRVNALAVQGDGRVLAAGWIGELGGAGRTGLIRLLPDGSVDPSFDAGPGLLGTINAMQVQSDDRILVAGTFTEIGAAARYRVARLLPDGSLDPSFDPGAGITRGFGMLDEYGEFIDEAAVLAMARQPDGKVIVAGGFARVQGLPRICVARLHPDGRVDLSFDVGAGPDGVVREAALQSDGKILIGGEFIQVDGIPRFRVARLNTDGSLDLTFDPGAGPTAAVQALAADADGSILIGGAFTTVNGAARRGIARLRGGTPSPFAPLLARDLPLFQSVPAGDEITLSVLATAVPEAHYQWQFNGADLPGATHWNLTLRNVRAQHSGNYSVVVTNAVGAILSSTLLLMVAEAPPRVGGPDIGFFAGIGPNDAVHAIAVQSDERILIGGAFTGVDGWLRGHVARLEKDGAVDLSFDPGYGANGLVRAVALTPAGQILMGGDFTRVDGTNRVRVARLNVDGSLDLTFDPQLGPNGSVYAVAVQPDGRVVLGGAFTAFNGVARSRVAQLHPDGSLDPGFVPPTINSIVRSLAIRPDGKLVVGGHFTQFGNATVRYVGLLNQDGRHKPGYPAGSSPTGPVLSVSALEDGRVLLGGDFPGFSGLNVRRVTRLNLEGSLDAKFETSVNAPVYAAALQPDGKALIGGAFTQVGAAERRGIARLDIDGANDAAFDPGTGTTGGGIRMDEYGQLEDFTTVLAVATQGRHVLVGGNFTRVDGVTRPYLARLLGRPTTVALQLATGPNQTGRRVELIWETGVLEAADDLSGPWREVTGGASPYPLSLEGAQKFYRLRIE